MISFLHHSFLRGLPGSVPGVVLSDAVEGNRRAGLPAPEQRGLVRERSDTAALRAEGAVAWHGGDAERNRSRFRPQQPERGRRPARRRSNLPSPFPPLIRARTRVEDSPAANTRGSEMLRVYGVNRRERLIRRPLEATHRSTRSRRIHAVREGSPWQQRCESQSSFWGRLHNVRRPGYTCPARCCWLRPATRGIGPHPARQPSTAPIAAELGAAELHSCRGPYPGERHFGCR